MHVYFGLGLDGRACLPGITESEATFGKSIVGPLGMLHLLETAAGTVGPEIRDIQRMLNYLRALQAVNSPARFFHASLKTDPLAVARHLLNVRDELKMSGWNGNAVSQNQRLHDFAAIESAAKEISGIPDRLVRAIERFKECDTTSLASVDLVDSLEHFPELWRQAIELLKAKKSKITNLKIDFNEEPHSGDLGSVRKSLAFSSVAAPKGDGTFRVLVGQDPWQAARWMVAWLANQGEDISQSVIIAPSRYRRILAAAFAERQIPFGDDGGTPSIARPAVQVLVLSLALAWAPKDPKAALALLLLPISPIPRAMAFRLAGGWYRRGGDRSWGAYRSMHAPILNPNLQGCRGRLRR